MNSPSGVVERSYSVRLHSCCEDSMIITGTEDLRVQKTMTAIGTAFSDLLLESDFDALSIKTLCARAKINKKTFYRYYATLYELFQENIEKISIGYLERIAQYTLPDDFRQINREFFLYATEQGKLFEKIVCHPSYATFGRDMISTLVRKTWASSTFFSRLDFYRQNILLCFVFNTGISLYQQWIQDDKTLSLEEIINISESLLYSGITGFFTTQTTRNKEEESVIWK